MCLNFRNALFKPETIFMDRAHIAKSILWHFYSLHSVINRNQCSTPLLAKYFIIIGSTIVPLRQKYFYNHDREYHAGIFPIKK